MSNNITMEKLHFDPGGREAPPDMSDCTLDVVNGAQKLSTHARDRKAFGKKNESCRDLLGDDDSAIASLDLSITPMAEHTLDSIPCTQSDVPSISSDHGYGTSSLASYDSGVVTGRDTSHGANVLTPAVKNTLSTSEPLALPRHADSAKEGLRIFAHRMNFSDSEFERSIQQLGVKGTDYDRLLNHLVKSRESGGTLQTKASVTSTSSKAQSTSKSSTQQKPEGDSKGLRRIVIDGSNVAMEHGLHQIYSCRGIEITVNYFQLRGHEHITVFVPAHRLRTEHLQTKDQHVLNELSRKGVVVKTPSRKSSKGHIASYEDRFILKLASMENAIVVSNDQFRDLKSESASFRETIEKRILPFVFANDQFIPAEDPLGKRGPTLEQFLRVNPYSAASGTCPYGRKCTYGTKCKFGHPEREESHDSALGDSSLSAGAQHSDFRPQPNRPMTFEQYNRTVANTLMPPAVNYPPYVMMRNPSRQTVSNPLPQGYYLPVGHMRQSFAASSEYAEYPQMAVLPVPPAVRACLHDRSYRSLPQDDMQFQSRQPGHPLVTPAQESPTSSASPQNSISATECTSSMFSDLSSDSCSQPLPLSEHLPSNSSHSTQSTRLAEGRQRHPYDAPILPTDPRYNMYFHLSGLFNEKVVRRVMNKYPNETKSENLTRYVLQMQPKVIVDC